MPARAFYFGAFAVSCALLVIFSLAAPPDDWRLSPYQDAQPPGAWIYKCDRCKTQQPYTTKQVEAPLCKKGHEMRLVFGNKRRKG